MTKINLLKRKKLKIKRKTMWKISTFKNNKTYYLVDFDEDTDLATWGIEKNAMVFTSRDQGLNFVSYFDLNSRGVKLVKRKI
jgi:hypothetical protein